MEMHNLLQFFREQMEIWNRIPYTLERNGIPFVRECTVAPYNESNACNQMLRARDEVKTLEK